MRSCCFACVVPCRAVSAMLQVSWPPFGLQGVWTKAEHGGCVLSLWPARHPHGCGDPQPSHNGYGLHPSCYKRIFPLRRGKMNTKMTMHVSSLSPSTWGKKQENTKMGGFCLVGMSWGKGWWHFPISLMNFCCSRPNPNNFLWNFASWHLIPSSEGMVSLHNLCAPTYLCTCPSQWTEVYLTINLDPHLDREPVFYSFVYFQSAGSKDLHCKWINKCMIYNKYSSTNAISEMLMLNQWS